MANQAVYLEAKKSLMKHLPAINAPLAEKSSYSFNDYFRQRMPVWRGDATRPKQD